MARLTVNGQSHTVDADPDTPLFGCCGTLSGLTGTNMVAASRSAARAPCTWTDGRALMLGACKPGRRQADHDDRRARSERHSANVQKAWLEHDVPQCGYCQSGMIMAVAALLKDKPKPTDADIDREITNICRCGTFQQVRAAIHAAASA